MRLWPQPHSLPLEIAISVPSSPTARPSAPTMSKRPPCASCTWGTRNATLSTISEASPTDIQNSACQLKSSATQADSGRPMAPPTPRVALIDAIAVLVIAGGVTSRISEMPDRDEAHRQPLEHPAAEHRQQRVGERADQRAHDEQDRAADQHPLLAEHVGEPPGDRHRDRTAEQRGGDDPGRVGGGGVQQPGSSVWIGMTSVCIRAALMPPKHRTMTVSRADAGACVSVVGFELTWVLPDPGKSLRTSTIWPRSR